MEKVNKNPLGRYALKNWWRYLIAAVTMGTSIALDIWFPIITMSIVDDVIIKGNMEMLPKNLACILIVGLGRAFTQYVKELTCDITGSRVASDVRKNLFQHIQTLSKTYFDKNNTGELMARVKDDVDRIWDIFGFVGMLAVEAFSYTIGIIICMVNLNWKLSILPIAVLPVMGFLAIRLERILDKVYDNISEQNAALNTVVQENLSGMRAVKSFAREDYEMEKFRKNNEKYYDLNVEQAYIMAKFGPNMSFLTKLMQLLTLLIGGYLVIEGEVTLGVLTAFIQYANNIVWPMENLGWLANAVAAAFASNKKINHILAEKPEITDRENAVSLEQPTGDLIFDHVSFDLHESKILEDISFHLESGHTLGIMGMTGAGKSTIVNLINRFYDVNAGSICLDGKDIRELTLESVRDCTSVVTQDVFLFSDTIRENIKLGRRRTMSDKTVKNALSTAHASEFVDKLGAGYDTVIGERGVGLSGGQKQRLSIARALAKNAKILILDDSTSALDMETEYEIQQELAAKKDVSKIIIAHRISSVRNADEIIVLDHGRIAERGRHEELMKKKGMYYTTYEAQYGDYRKAIL